MTPQYVISIPDVSNFVFTWLPNLKHTFIISRLKNLKIKRIEKLWNVYADWIGSLVSDFLVGCTMYLYKDWIMTCSVMALVEVGVDLELFCAG